MPLAALKLEMNQRGFSRNFFAFFLLAFGIGSGSLSQAQEQTLVAGFDADSAPFSYLDENDSPDGFDLAVIRLISEDADLQLILEPLLYDELVAGLQSREIGVIVTDFAIADIAKVRFTRPYLEVGEVLVVKNDSDFSLEQLQGGGYSIGVKSGTAESVWLESNGFDDEALNRTLVSFEANDEAVGALLDDEVTALAMNEEVAQEIAAEEAVRILGPFGMPPVQLAFAVRTDDPALWSLIDERLGRLMSSPEWEVLKSQYDLE